jgi:periplasmic protein TonB
MFHLNHKPMNLDDIVFENRNREYGAYPIRKHYSDRVNRAVVLSVGFFALLLTLPTIFNTQKLIPDSLVRDPITTLAQPPAIKVEPARQTPPPARVQRTVRNLPPRVVNTPVVAPVEPVIEPVAASVEDFDGPVTLSGTGDVGPAVVEPAVVEPPRIYDHTEILPSYKGGMEAMARFLSSKIRYPAAPRRLGQEGTVYVSFVIGADGNVTDVKLVKGFNKECDAEALRVVSIMPAWNPGIQGGNAVMVRRVLPIKFQLDH